MNELAAIAEESGIPLVEDAAQGILASYDERPLGSFGSLATFSFHETKNVHCGEGGALLVNDAVLAERAEILLDKGTNRRRFFRGQVDKYSWVDIGSCTRPARSTPPFCWAQLEDADAITARRLAIWRTYHAAFADLERAGSGTPPGHPRRLLATTRTCTTSSSLISNSQVTVDQRTQTSRYPRGLSLCPVSHFGCRTPLRSGPQGN